MRKWLVLSPETEEVFTEDDIIFGGYYEYWKGRMQNKYGSNSELITKENCIEDWIVIHWATEIKE